MKWQKHYFTGIMDSSMYNVTFLPGQKLAQFDVSIDDATGGNETLNFDLIINASSLPYNTYVGNPDQATVTMASQCKYRHTL